MLNKKDFIETCKRLIRLAEKYGDDALLELDGTLLHRASSERVNTPAKRNVMIVKEGDSTTLNFNNRKELVEHYKLPDSCLANWPHVQSVSLTLKAEDELINAEAVYLGRYMSQIGTPIKAYGRYRAKRTGGMFHSVNLAELNGAPADSTVPEGALL